MSYPFVLAAYDYGRRKAPVLAFLVHMAEGGNTVAYLHNNPARGVSVHYVIEYSGRVVQMLDESHASGSVDPTSIRTTDDPVPPYGATAAHAALGAWWMDPNAAVISCELEGFATAGPKPTQAAALEELVEDVRGRHPLIGLLGHRDFTVTKACPGRHIDWAALGGHGAAGGDDVINPALDIPAAVCDVLPGGPLMAADKTTVLDPSWAGGKDIGLYARPALTKGFAAIRIDRASGPAEQMELAWVPNNRIANVRVPGAAPTVQSVTVTGQNLVITGP